MKESRGKCHNPAAKKINLHSFFVGSQLKIKKWLLTDTVILRQSVPDAYKQNFHLQAEVH